MIINDALETDAGLGYELLVLPAPQEDLPVGLTRERYDLLLIFRTKGTRDELLGVVGVTVLDLLWKSFLLFTGTVDIVDSELAFVTSSAAFAHG